MKKKNLFIISIFIVLAIFVLAYSMMFDSSVEETEYSSLLEQIENANERIIDEDLQDDCFPYRYFHRGCYYTTPKFHLDNSYNGDINLSYLMIEQRIEICHKYAHQGASAWCLRNNVGIGECLNQTGDNEYLQLICNLEDNQSIGDGRGSDLVDGMESEERQHIPQSYSSFK